MGRWVVVIGKSVFTTIFHPPFYCWAHCILSDMYIYTVKDIIELFQL